MERERSIAPDFLYERKLCHRNCVAWSKASKHTNIRTVWMDAESRFQMKIEIDIIVRKNCP